MGFFSKLTTANKYYTRALIVVIIVIVVYSVFITMRSPEPCLRDCLENIEIMTHKVPLTGSLRTIVGYCRKTCDRFFPKQKTRRQVSALTKKMVASNQKWRCASCGGLLDFTYEIDHIQPLGQGGSNEVENLQALCPHCHRVKTLAESQR
jgi:hypothetical protein